MMSDGPSVPLAPPPSFPLSDLTNTIFFSCGSVRYLAVATCPIISLSLPVRRTIDVGLSASSSFSLVSSFPSLITQPLYPSGNPRHEILMDRSRDQLLAGAGLAEDEDGGVGARPHGRPAAEVLESAALCSLSSPRRKS